ncbi:MAG: cyclic pyranopterin monophosphate synthase MoaC [Planctomycetia bacterium]|jgi:cyclic pyranopterin monophosphate synthase|nr:cyclic pyranopterin monophosphate synthase MoaC [Planctomycetia bacterium]MBL6915404.1 cyclic pyranopterin monophosphate synthase MoaC [Planctomycetota bacterium]NCG55415.1 cyclic pyranopterin monophosphate synthase MoaC [Pseudomonadota bacterium]MDC3251442.1 cyclic pyranopterin monophosphate synthase MoaC [Planctomycetota bacterium]MDG1454771.1 cyclic pyranopterin monophosphate synthase MoaC [Planctomycetota bacterium]
MSPAEDVSPSEGLSHTNEDGESRMVDVGDKKISDRRAVAEGRILMNPSTLELISEGEVEKGDVLAVARIAAIQGAKETSRLIPMCHPLPLDHVEVEIENGVEGDRAWVMIRVQSRVQARTGVEMEAMVAVSAGLLTIYDMCKAVDRHMELDQIRLLEKSGGRSGHWTRAD